MKTRLLSVFVLALILTLSACSPFMTSSTSVEQPTPIVESIPATGYQPVDVDQVEVEVGVGSPIPVHVNVSGNLPDSCAQIELVEEHHEGSNFFINLYTVSSNEEGCIQDSLPLKMSYPLNVVNLPAGSYTVDVNGSSVDFELDTANTSASLPTGDTVLSQDDVQVDDVNVEIGFGSPIPVHAIVSLNLPNTCAQIGQIRLHREGTTFYVRLIASIAERADCRADSIPFRAEIPLNIVNLPEGPYDVNVNGVTASFDPNAEPTDHIDLGDFESQLQAALTQHDAEGMRMLMGERFVLAYWQSEGESIPSEQAMTQLLNGHIPENFPLEFREFQDIPAFDAQAFVGPDVELAKAIYVTGWGKDGMSHAILFVSRRPDGSLFWQGVLVAPPGFAPPMGQACTEPVEVTVVNGQASYNGISFSIDPTLDYGLAARICLATTDEEAHPPYTEFFFPTYSRGNTDYQPQIRVYELTDDLEKYLFPINSLHELQTAIEQRPRPILWFQNSALHTQEAYLDFANGAGVRGLIQLMQDYFFYTNNGLIYEFHGLTEDRRRFVSVRYPVSVPFLMELDGFSLPPNNINPNAIAIAEWPSVYEDQRRIIESYNNEAIDRFEQMPGSDAMPDIALLDALVESLRVSKP